MYRVSVLYGTPTDVETFQEYYRTTHIPLAKKMHGLKRWTLTWVEQQDGDFAPGIHLIADLYADDRAAMEQILSSPEGVAAAEDVPNFATGGATFVRGVEEAVL